MQRGDARLCLRQLGLEGILLLGERLHLGVRRIGLTLRRTGGMSRRQNANYGADDRNNADNHSRAELDRLGPESQLSSVSRRLGHSLPPVRRRYITQ